MMRPLRKLFRKPATVSPAPISPVVAASAHGEETAEAEYAAFCGTFYIRPGVRFIDIVRRHRVQPLADWLRPETADAEPKALIRLMLKMTREGVRV